MEDRIPGWLQHYHKMCCKKGGHYGRQTCIIWRWFHHGDVISGCIDLYMTLLAFFIFSNNSTSGPSIITSYKLQIQLSLINT